MGELTTTETPGILADEAGDEVLDVAALSPRPRYLKHPIDGKLYRIRGNLPLETMLRLFSAEELVSASKNDAEIAPVLRDLEVEVHELLTEYDEEAPPLRLGIQEAMGVLAFLAGNKSMVAAFVETVTAGRGEKLDVANRNGDAADADAPEEIDGTVDGRPLRPGKQSSEPSSRSAKSTGGGRSGGSGRGARGERSGRTATKQPGSTATQS